MSEAIVDAPLRQLSRLRSEMTIAEALLSMRSFGGQVALSVPFGVVAQRCLPDWRHEGGLAPPAEPRRAISIRQIALSLGAPAETVRRMINQLRDDGKVTITPSGVALATTPEAEAFLLPHLYTFHDIYVRLLEDLGKTADLDLPVAPEPCFDVADVLDNGIATTLLTLDTFHLGGTITAFLIWGALTAVAVREVTYDPILARRYANALPPDEFRRSISLRSLADLLSIPYATAWRNMQALQQRGLVTRMSGERWTVLTANLLTDEALAVASPVSSRTFRKIRELAMLGFDPARAGEHYRLGRPPLVDLNVPRNG